jgi:hypothetical protein
MQSSEVAGRHTLPFLKGHGLPILMHFIACPPATSEAGASRPKSLAGAIFMVYPQKYKNCSTLAPASEVTGYV